MSRSGYSDDCEGVALWRGTVASAIRGRRGQAFLHELIESLDALPEKRLIRDALWIDDPACATRSVCAIGSVGHQRGINMNELDAHDYDALADTFGIAHHLVQEIEFMNDEYVWPETPEQRWQRIRDW